MTSHLWAWLCAAILFAACASDEGLSSVDAPEAYGQLELRLGVPTRAATTVISAEEARNFLITVRRGGDIVRGPLALGSMDMRLPAGQGYAVFAENCNEATAETANEGWGQKRFIGLSDDFGIQHGQTTRVEVGLSVANAAFSVVLGSSMAHYFRHTSTVAVIVGQRRMVWDAANTGRVEDGGAIADGQLAFFNIPQGGTLDITYTIRAVTTDGQVLEQEGTATLSPARNTRLNLEARSGSAGIEIQVDEQMMRAEESLVVRPEDVIQDDGKTEGAAQHDGFGTDGTQAEYDTYDF